MGVAKWVLEDDKLLHEQHKHDSREYVGSSVSHRNKQLTNKRSQKNSGLKVVRQDRFEWKLTASFVVVLTEAIL